MLLVAEASGTAPRLSMAAVTAAVPASWLTVTLNRPVCRAGPFRRPAPAEWVFETPGGVIFGRAGRCDDGAAALGRDRRGGSPGAGRGAVGAAVHRDGPHGLSQR